MSCCTAIRVLAVLSVQLFAIMPRNRLYLPEIYPGWWSFGDELREMMLVKGLSIDPESDSD